MRKVLPLSVLLASAAIIAAAPIHDRDGILLEEGGVPIVRHVGKTVFLDTFQEENNLWLPHTNYEHKLKIERRATPAAMTITNPQSKKSDTAWEITTKPFGNLGSSTALGIIIEASGTVDMHTNRPHKELYFTAIQWLGADGKTIALVPFGFLSKSRKPVQTYLEFPRPEGATMVSIRLGADSPNVRPNEILAISRVEAQLLDAKSKRLPQASFVSGVHRLRPGDMLSWEADCPPGTDVAFQLSTATEVEGTPTAWTPFRGPDGSDKTFFRTKPFSLNFPPAAKWLRYKAFLNATGAESPKLRSVTVGAVTDANYENPKPQAPRLFQRTPARSLDPKVPVSFQITDDTAVNWRTLTVALDGKDITAEVKRNGDTVTYIPATPFEPLPGSPNPDDLSQPFPDAPIINLHSCTVHVEDIEGNPLDVTFYFSIGESPKSNLVTVRDDGFTLVDGKPFFPIGLYAVWKREFNNSNFDNCFAELQKNGFNLVHTYNSRRCPDFTEFMDKAHQYGMKLYIASNFGANRMDPKAVLQTVLRERNHPALLAWYLADDTASHVTWQELQSLSSAVRAVDPGRITIQADPVGAPDASRYFDFVDATDGFLPEIYPIRGPEGKPGVAKVVTDMKTIQKDLQLKGNPPRTIWAIVQYFQGWSSWVRFPTFAELRAMTYLSIINGAHGMTWYTYGGYNKNHGVTDTPETWRNITTVAKELAALQDILVERNPPQPPAPVIVDGPTVDTEGNHAVSILLKVHQGKKFLLASCSAEATVKAQITLPGVKSAKVLFEDRTIQLADGVLTDTFTNYGTHVYELE